VSSILAATARPISSIVATLNRGVPVALKNTLGIELGLKVSIYYRVPRDRPGPSWSVSTTSYLYALTGPDERELMAWHWHPGLEGEVKTTHMHIQSAILNEAYMPFARRHLPTGRIALEDVAARASRSSASSPAGPAGATRSGARARPSRIWPRQFDDVRLLR